MHLTTRSAETAVRLFPMDMGDKAKDILVFFAAWLERRDY
jgi:hypothetical protein